MITLNPKFSILFCFFAALFIGENLKAQQLNRKIQVVDFETKESLPYANVYLLGSSTWGTVSDQDGQVLIKLNGFQKTDSLAFSFIGYETLKLSVLEVKSRKIIELTAAENILNTLVLKPLSAEEYLKKCIKYIPDNQPDTTFSTLSYYAEKGLENGEFLSHNEAVLRTYYPQFKDSSKLDQHEVLLFEASPDTKELDFMSKRIKKPDKKERKKLKEDGNDSTEVNNLDVRDMFGGFTHMFSSLRLNNSEVLLDSTNYKKFDISFHNEALFNEKGEEIVLILVSTKRRLDGAKLKAKIYIHRDDLAIMKIEMKGDQRIPALVKPLLLMFGISIDKPQFSQAINFVKQRGKWYPNVNYYTLDVRLTDINMFKKNTHSQFKLLQALDVQYVDFDNAKAIPKEFRYKSDEKLKDQVYRPGQVNWSEISKIQL